MTLRTRLPGTTLGLVAVEWSCFKTDAYHGSRRVQPSTALLACVRDESMIVFAVVCQRTMIKLCEGIHY